MPRPLPGDVADTALWGGSRAQPKVDAPLPRMSDVALWVAGATMISFVGTLGGLAYMSLSQRAGRSAVQGLPLLPGSPLVFLDVADGDEPVGRIILQLRSDVAPAAVASFAALCEAPLGYGYRSSPLHGVERGSRVFGGDWYGGGRGGMAAGAAAEGGVLPVESYALRHVGPGCLAMRTTSVRAASVASGVASAAVSSAVSSGASSGVVTPAGSAVSGAMPAGTATSASAAPPSDDRPPTEGIPPAAATTPIIGSQFYLTLRASELFDGVHEVIGHVVNDQGFAVLEFLDRRAGANHHFREGHDFRIARCGVLPAGEPVERHDGGGHTSKLGSGGMTGMSFGRRS